MIFDAFWSSLAQARLYRSQNESVLVCLTWQSPPAVTPAFHGWRGSHRRFDCSSWLLLARGLLLGVVRDAVQDDPSVMTLRLFMRLPHH